MTTISAIKASMNHGATQMQHETRADTEWKVTDPIRVADGFYGTTFHKTKCEAERRVAMFPGSVMEHIGAAP